jgi:hypothetical protein
MVPELNLREVGARLSTTTHRPPLLEQLVGLTAANGHSTFANDKKIQPGCPDPVVGAQKTIQSGELFEQHGDGHFALCNLEEEATGLPAWTKPKR